MIKRRRIRRTLTIRDRIPICGTLALRLQRQRDRALNALYWRHGKLWTPPQFAPATVTAAELGEVDHGHASNQHHCPLCEHATKIITEDHHPKSDPGFFDDSTSADTSTVRSSLSPDPGPAVAACSCGLDWSSPGGRSCAVHGGAR